MPRRKRGGQQKVEVGMIESLSPTDDRSTRKEFRRLQKAADSPEVDFENKLWLLVHSLNPEIISIGRDPVIHLRDGVFKPSAIGIFDHSILIIEGKYTDESSFITDWISKYRNSRRHLHEILVRKYPDRSIVVVLAVKDARNIQERLLNELRNIRVKLIDEREINYYASLQKAVGVGVRHIFWGRVRPNVPNIGMKKLPCLRVSKGKKDFYIFAANPDDILCRAFISHREIHEPDEGIIGYQRMLQKKKLSEIAQYIQSRTVSW